MMPFMLGPATEPSPEQQAAIDRYIEAHRALEIAERHTVLRWAGLFCSCQPWFAGFGQPPPQAGCVVHAQIAWDHNAKKWIV